MFASSSINFLRCSIRFVMQVQIMVATIQKSMKVDWPLQIISVDLNHGRDRKSCERERHVDHDAFAHSWKARIKSMLLTGSGAAQRREMQRRRAAGAIHLNAMSFAIHLNAMRRSWRCSPLECGRRSWRCIVGQSPTNYVVSGHAWQDNMYTHVYTYIMYILLLLHNSNQI